MRKPGKPLTTQQLREENRMLLEEVHTAHRAAALNAKMVVKEIARLETMRLELQEKNLELQLALAEIDSLRNTLPICACCKSIRDDEGYWQQIEIYLQEHSNTELTHGICPDCEEKMYGQEPWFQRMRKKRAANAAKDPAEP